MPIFALMSKCWPRPTYLRPGVGSDEPFNRLLSKRHTSYSFLASFYHERDAVEKPQNARLAQRQSGITTFDFASSRAHDASIFRHESKDPNSLGAKTKARAFVP